VSLRYVALWCDVRQKMRRYWCCVLIIEGDDILL